MKVNQTSSEHINETGDEPYCGFGYLSLGTAPLDMATCSQRELLYRLLARGSIAPPPLGNFADIPYLKEQFKLSRIRDVCTLSVGALSCNSLLHMLP